MSIRQIAGLRYARPLPKRPTFIPAARPRGVRALGARYEKALARALPGATHGQWFEFMDSNGPGYCQTDLILELPGSRRMLAVLEVKHTWTIEAHDQLESLYLPVVETALHRLAIGIVVCKRVIPFTLPDVVCTGDLWHAAELAQQGTRPVFHWLGKGALFFPAKPANTNRGQGPQRSHHMSELSDALDRLVNQVADTGDVEGATLALVDGLVGLLRAELSDEAEGLSDLIEELDNHRADFAEAIVANLPDDEDGEEVEVKTEGKT